MTLAGMEELGDVHLSVVDLQALRRQRLEDEQLRVLATAVGDHPLPIEQLTRLERVRAQLRYDEVGSAPGVTSRARGTP